MKNIILQHFDGDLRPLDKLSMANIQQYAEMVGAEYRLITGRPFREHLTSACQKVHMLHEEFDDYDTVLMLDIDMFAPVGMTENVFDVKGIGLYAQTQQMLHRRLAQGPGSMNHPYWGGAIYKLSKKDRQSLREGLGGNEKWMDQFNQPYHYEDEGIMHILALKQNYKPKNPYMHRKWCQCSFLPNPENAGFIHVRTKITPIGPKREKIENYNELKSKGIL
jgi:hypothetical protein